MPEVPNIEVVEMGTDCVFAMFVKVDDKGVSVRSNAHGISRQGAIAVLRDYADALEKGLVKITEGEEDG